MSDKNPFADLVFSLPNKDFQLLQDAVALRRGKERYGVTNFSEPAKLYGRVPICPHCNSDEYVSFGFTPDGLPRYKCAHCGRKFSLLSNSIFHSTNKSIDTWISYLTLMTFNVPLEMAEEICDISHPTAMLWSQKVFATVDGYQAHLYLKDRVWIDETYIFGSVLIPVDSPIMHRLRKAPSSACWYRRS